MTLKKLKEIVNAVDAKYDNVEVTAMDFYESAFDILEIEPTEEYDEGTWIKLMLNDK